MGDGIARGKALAGRLGGAGQVQFAAAAAALSVTKLGAQPSAPLRRDIEKFLRAH